MNHLELRENGDWVPAPFEADIIGAACASGLLESRITSAGPQVKPQLNRIGSVATDSYEFVVQPKVPFSSVLFMLGFAANPGFRPDEVSGAGTDIFPSIAETFARRLEKALEGGVLQGYRRLDESAVAVRGRVRFSDQISRRGGQLLPIELTVDDYTVDIAENQIVRAAARLLLTLPQVTKDVRRRLTHLESRVVEASALQSGTGIPAWQASRLNERYQPALHFAELILRRLAPSTIGRGERIASFVVNMAEAYEGFVTSALTEAVAEVSRGLSVAQYPTHLDRERRQPIRPDFVHLVGGKPVVVADAKYKTGMPRAEDLYQMLGYCTVLGLTVGTLIYVSDGSDTRGQVASVQGSGVIVRIGRIDVSASPARMIDQVVDIARVSIFQSREGNGTLSSTSAESRIDRMPTTEL